MGGKFIKGGGAMNSYMIVGGQWGSEGKGLFAGYMADVRQPDAVVSQFGPNAGHTWIEGDIPIVFKSLPVASIAKSVKRVFLGPGSVINPEILEKEIDNIEQLLGNKNIFVHEAAAIIMPGDMEAEEGENGVTHIASTRQGTAEAMIRKIRRRGAYPASVALRYMPVTVVNHRLYWGLIHESKTLQIEGSQGMDLSINSGYVYPYTTSRDCTPSQVLADCGLHPHDIGQIYACIRTYPIRVGNIIDADGKTLGTSGPCYHDQKEITWGDIGVRQELTTVTKRVRRVFTFSFAQIQKLIDEVQPTGIFLNFANYLLSDGLLALKRDIDKMAGRSIVKWIGYGPKHTDIASFGPEPIQPPEYKE